MAELHVGVKLDAGGIAGQLSALNGKYNIQVNVKTTGASKETVADLAQLARAQVQIAKADTDATKAATGLAKAQAQASKAANALAKTEAQVHAEQTKLNREIEKTNQLYAKKAVEAQKTATQAQKTATAQVQAKAKETQATANLTKEENRLAVEQEKTRRKTLSAGNAHRQTASDVDRHANATGRLTMSMGQALMQFTLVRSAVTALRSAFRDALNEMKAVDKELVTVAKVSGLSGQGLTDLTNKAYSAGSRYGVKASDYLNSAGEFARAGYRGSDMEQMSELAVKTQIVGDVTETVANQFLLATAAAYGFQGNVSALNDVLDSANELDNKYATSIAKIAEGMGIVAPMASQMNVGVNELMSAIGTITAVTQRSGTEAARALRALFLNIQAEVGHFEDESGDTIEVTEESIASLTGLLEKYDKAAYDAAKATGQVLNPMKAMASIAKAYKDGLLTQNDLLNLSSALGGKLRSNQLQAILSSWGMYESMLSDASSATGSAEQEVSRYLDSWEAKTNQLSNTWTEFVANLVNTNAIKAGLDIVTNAISFLDTGFGRTTVTVIGLVTAFAALRPVLLGIKSVFSTFKLSALLAGLQHPAIATALMALAGIAVAGTVVSGIVKAVKQPEKTAEEAKSDYEASLSDVEALNKKLDENKKKIADIKALGPLSPVDEQAISNLDQENEKLETYLELAQRKAVLDRNEYLNAQAKLFNQANTKAEETEAHANYNGSAFNGNTISYVNKLSYAMQQFRNERMKAFEDHQKHPATFQTPAISDNEKFISNTLKDWDELLEEGKAYYDQISKVGEAFRTAEETTYYKEYTSLLERRNKLQGEYNSVIQETKTSVEEVREATEQNTVASENTSANLQQMAEDASSLADELNGATQALKDFNDVASGTQEGDAFAGYEQMFSKGRELFEAGKIGNSTYQASLRSFLGEGFEPAFKASGYDWGRLGSSVYGENSAYARIFGTDGDNAKVLDNVIEALKGTRLEKAITKTGNAFEVVKLSASELAKELGISEDAANAIFDMLSQYAPALKTSARDAEEYGKQLQKIGGAKKNEDGRWTFDEASFMGLFEDSEKGRTQARELMKAFQDLGLVDFTNLRELPETVSEATASVEEVKDSVQETKEAVEEPPKEPEPVKLTADASEVISASNSATKAIESVPETHNTTFTATYLDPNDPDNPFQSYTDPGGQAHYRELNGHWSYASGTDNARSGKAFVNELEPELIVRGSDKKGYIANSGHPAVVTLGSGDAVIPLSAFGDGDTNRTFVRNHAAAYIPVVADIVKPGRSGVGTLPDAKQEEEKTSNKKGSGGPSKKKEDTTDYLKIIREYVEFQLSRIQSGITELEHKITLIERERDALLKPLNDQVEELNDANDALSRSATLLKRAQEAETKPLEKQVKELDRASKALNKQIKALQKERDALVKPLQEQADTLERANEEEEKRLELEEKQLAVEKARKALAEASERTVRVFNQRTGQWEWIKDAKTIRSAQENLDNAQKNLDEYLKKKEIQDIKDQITDIKDAYQTQIDVLDDQNEELSAQKEALNERIEAINDAYEVQLEAIEDQQTAISDALYDLEQLQKQINRQYQDMIDPIDAQRQAMQEQYDDFSYEWKRIEEAFEENTTNINQILQKFSKQQLPKMAEAVEMVTSLLRTLGGGEIGGRLTFDNAVSAVSSASDISARFASTASVNGIMLGAGRPAYAGGGYTVNGTASTTNNNGNNYYINGVMIGGDMLSRPLSDVLSTLGIYTST